MEYQDFYDIADYFNNLNCQVYTEKEIATNAYEYKSEYDYSMRKATQHGQCLNCANCVVKIWIATIRRFKKTMRLQLNRCKRY